MNKFRIIICLALLALFAVACGQGEPPQPLAELEAVPTVIPTAVPAEPEEMEEPEVEEPAQAEETAVEEPAGTEVVVQDWTTAWMLNETGATGEVFSSIIPDVQDVYITNIDGKDYQCIVASGIPSYETVATQELIDSLNDRPLAARDFGTGGTTLSLGDVVAFGGDVGYAPQFGCTDDEGYGYWPPGPACPTDQAKEQCFPLDPEPHAEGELCETGINDLGTWVNGVAIFNWSDTASYNGDGVWQNEAFHFEFYDLDVCPGHSANGNYHHHSNPVCLADQLGDVGDGHSMIYGFAADGYPIYGPWHDTGVLTQSCWKARDYDDPNSPTGCGVAGERSCLLIDQYDISLGTVPAESTGPTTSQVVSSMSGNEFVTTSGYYFEDYYYDASCTAQGIEYLDEHNGHDHDGLGYHYHVTVEQLADGTFSDVFPFYVGPAYAGVLQNNAIAACSTGQMMGPPGGGEGGPPQGGGPGGPPDFAAIAAALGVTEQALRDGIGGPPPDFEAASEALGISVEEIEAAFEANGAP